MIFVGGWISHSAWIIDDDAVIDLLQMNLKLLTVCTLQMDIRSASAVR